METHVTHRVSDIPGSGRAFIEQLLGRPLENDQRVFIMAYTPPADFAARSAARDRLQQFLAAQASRAARQGITANEADAAVEEAMRHVRPRVK
jgi:hypothetical protein